MYGPNGYCVRAGEQWADQQKCWYNGITFATSTDRGATYIHSAAPTHYVGSLPYRYEPGIGPAGFFSPSNIVRGRDGYHYVMVHVEGHGAQADGSCLWRTRDLSDRKSWRAWGGAGFTVRFLDPYPNDITDPAQHVCAPIGAGTNLGTASESLTWSTYFKQWLVVHATGGGMGTGFYSYTSDDLINWTPAKLVLNAKLPWAHTCGEPDYVLYPSLLDPDSKSRNFETTGQRPYLFFTHFNVGYNSGGCWMSIDRDLVRIPMEFSNQEPGGPAAALTASTTTARTGEPVRFDASGSRDADGTITRYQWDLDGDGAYERDTGTSPVAQRSYEAPDDVTVTVRVSDDDGKATDDTQIVRVTGPVLGSSGGAGAASAPSPAAGVPAAPARSAAIARFRVVGTPRARRDGSVSLRVRAPAAGRLLVRAAGRKLIRAARAVAARPGTLALRVKPSVRGRVLLGRRGRLRVKAAISFTPVGGVRQSESQTLTLRLARRA
jgi:hypothetical protein